MAGYDRPQVIEPARLRGRTPTIYWVVGKANLNGNQKKNVSFLSLARLITKPI